MTKLDVLIKIEVSFTTVRHISSLYVFSFWDVLMVLAIALSRRRDERNVEVAERSILDHIPYYDHVWLFVYWFIWNRSRTINIISNYIWLSFSFISVKLVAFFVFLSSISSRYAFEVLCFPFLSLSIFLSFIDGFLSIMKCAYLIIIYSRYECYGVWVFGY